MWSFCLLEAITTVLIVESFNDNNILFFYYSLYQFIVLCIPKTHCLLVLSSSLNEKGRGVPSARFPTCLTGLSPSRKSPRNTASVNLEKYSWGIGPRGNVLFSIGLHLSAVLRPPVADFYLSAPVLISFPRPKRRRDLGAHSGRYGRHGWPQNLLKSESLIRKAGDIRAILQGILKVFRPSTQMSLM